MTNTRTLALVLASSLALACGAPPPPPASPPPAASAPAAPAQPPPTASAAQPAEPAAPAQEAPVEPKPAQVASKVPIVKLLEPGAEPRSVMRLKLKPNTTETMVMTMTMQMSMTMGTTPLPAQDVPPIKQTLTLRIASVSPEAIRAEFTVTKVEVLAAKGSNPRLVRSLEEAMRGLVGTKGVTVMNDRGICTEATLEIPPDAPPLMKSTLESLRNSMTQLANPLPEEPVGVGARWDVITTSDAGGFVLGQTATHTLVERKGNAVKTTVAVRQSADPQPMKIATLPPGASAKLLSLATEGTGSSAYSLDRAVPTKGIADIVSRSTTEVTVGKEVQSARTTTTTHIVISPK